MSDWIKDNKFAAALLGIAFLAIVATYLFSGKKTEAYEEAKMAYDAAASDYSRLASTKPFPAANTLEDYRKDVVSYRGQVEGLQKALIGYRPETFEKISPAEFTTKINKISGDLKRVYDKVGITYPDNWQLGYETYTSSPPSDKATNYLNYQLDSLNWLYTSLAKAGPTELLNVYRPRLPIEDGKSMDAGGQGNNNARGNNRGNRGQANQGGTTPFYSLPVELTFKGSESSLRKFLSEIANSEDYFFVVRSVRIQNTKATVPPKKSSANFKVEEAAPAAGGDPFEGFDFVIPGDDAAPEGEDAGEEGEAPADEEPLVDPAPQINPAGDGEQTLGRLLGNEEIFVFLQLELILFRDNVALPEVK